MPVYLYDVVMCEPVHVLSSLSLFAEYTAEIRCIVSGEIVGASRYMVFFSVPTEERL